MKRTVKLEKTVTVRELSRNTRRLIQGVKRGWSYIITKRGRPIGILQGIPIEIALRVLPFDHPRVHRFIDQGLKEEYSPAGRRLAQLGKELKIAMARTRKGRRLSR